MQTRWAENKFERNTELCFVCTLGKFPNASLRFIARDVYNLYINGEFVQYGPARAAKGYARVEEVALGQYLIKEENVISLYVQSNNTKTLCFAWEPPLFGAEILVDGKLVCDTDGFRCFEMTDKLKKVEKMSYQRGYVEIYRMKKDRDPFDFSAFPECKLVPMSAPKLLKRNVSMAKHDVAVAELIQSGDVAIDTSKVWENDFTKLLDNGEKIFTYPRSVCECLLSKEVLAFSFDGEPKAEGYRYETYALTRTNCGKFRIKISAKSKATVWLAYDDILIDGYLKFNREQIQHALKWELEAGEYTLYSNEVYVAKYIALIIEGDACIAETAMLRVENPDTDGMIFICADKTLESVVEAARHSFQHNGYDLLTDCPSRERAGYLCDGFFTARAETFFTGKNLVEQNLLENYALFKNEKFVHDGILPMCYPSEPGGADDFIPNWVLWYVLELEDYLLRTGDFAFVAAQKEKVYAALDYFQGKENELGLLEDLDGWVFVEWSKANDFVDGVNFPSNMCYFGAIRAAARMFKDDALAKKAEHLKNTIIELSYNGEFFVDNALRVDGKLTLTENISETCQNYAAFFEIFTKAEKPDFYNRLVEKLGCFEREKHYPDVHASNMFIGYILRLSVLLREGEGEKVVAECKNRFADMAADTGTIWELFQTNASCDHGFGAVVGQMIAYALTGVAAIDEKKKVVYLHKDHLSTDCKVTMPLLSGVLTIAVENGARKAQATGEYGIVVLEK